jgi:hypothetical protein
MNTHQQERMKQALRQAMPPVAASTEPTPDLWPAMLRRMKEHAGAVPWLTSIPWYDWCLLGSLAALLVVFPASIPLLLYYL